MAAQFLTPMADLDQDSQERMAGWHDALRDAAFTDEQAPGLPYHISHVGMFARGKVLFGGPGYSGHAA